jgi:hypothetical protein
MSGSIQSICPQCGTKFRADETLCSACLLSAGDSATEDERIFQEALALPNAERLPFVEEATRGNAALYSAVLLLLQGYEEAGGDKAPPTLGDAINARAQWADASTEQPGSVIDHFRLVSLIGEGGMGSVWKASPGSTDGTGSDARPAG